MIGSETRSSNDDLLQISILKNSERTTQLRIVNQLE